MTARKLTPEQVRHFRDEGFLAPIPALSTAEAAALRAKLEAYEATLPAGYDERMYRRKLHVRLPWMRDLIEDARVLDAIEDLIGPDIFVFGSAFFIKEPLTDAIAAWHQDATYLGLEPPEQLTAWIAFTDASLEAGCMEFALGSHHGGQLSHAAAALANSVNHGAQALARPVAAAATGFGPLKAGEFSVHHALTAHQSAPNRSGHRRIGLNITYVPGHARHTGSQRMGAVLVRGTDRHGQFEMEPDPRGLSPEEAVRAHAEAYRRYNEGYREQIERHARAYA